MTQERQSAFPTSGPTRSGDTKKHVLRVFVDADEKHDIVSAAVERGYEPSIWIRNVLLRECRRKVDRGTDPVRGIDIGGL